jgi:predicted RNase H-like HicB family nuclease
VRYTAAISREGRFYVAQCLELDVASQGLSEDEALANLREALLLYLEEPSPPSRAPHIRHLDIEAHA